MPISACSLSLFITCKEMLHQVYTSSQLMDSPELREREFVRMGRVIVRSWLSCFFPRFTMTGFGIKGFRLPMRFREGICLNFLLSIITCVFCTSAKLRISEERTKSFLIFLERPAVRKTIREHPRRMLPIWY